MEAAAAAATTTAVYFERCPSFDAAALTRAHPHCHQSPLRLCMRRSRRPCLAPLTPAGAPGVRPGHHHHRCACFRAYYMAKLLTSTAVWFPRHPQERQVSGLVNAVLSKFESIDCVVNCAGVFGRGAFTDTPVMVGRGGGNKVLVTRGRGGSSSKSTGRSSSTHCN